MLNCIDFARLQGGVAFDQGEGGAHALPLGLAQLADAAMRLGTLEAAPAAVNVKWWLDRTPGGDGHGVVQCDCSEDCCVEHGAADAERTGRLIDLPASYSTRSGPVK
jgi:hypothetical protein